jgi:hypothetical protein
MPNKIRIIIDFAPRQAMRFGSLISPSITLLGSIGVGHATAENVAALIMLSDLTGVQCCHNIVDSEINLSILINE